MAKKHYVVFWCPGTLFAEDVTKPIDAWDTAEAMKLARKVAKGFRRPYAFDFITRVESDKPIEVDGVKLRAEPKQVATSCRHFIEGTVRTFDQVVAANNPREGILRSNMEGNRYALVVDMVGSTQPFDEDDCIVDANGAITARGSDKVYAAYRKAQLAKWKKERAR